MTMRKVLLRTKFIQVFIWCVLQSLNCLAAEQLIAFQPTANSWPMKVLAISYQTNEHSCVKLAAQNLQTDLEKVTGLLLREELLCRNKQKAPAASSCPAGSPDPVPGVLSPVPSP